MTMLIDCGCYVLYEFNDFSYFNGVNLISSFMFLSRDMSTETNSHSPTRYLGCLVLMLELIPANNLDRSQR